MSLDPVLARAINNGYYNPDVNFPSSPRGMWIDGRWNPDTGAVNTPRTGAPVPGTGNNFSSFSSFSSPLGPGAGPRLSSPNDNAFGTVQNTKNPDLQSAINSVLSSIQGLNSNPNVNTNVVKTNTKSDQAQGSINKGFSDLNAAINDHNISIADFAKTFLDSQPEAAANTKQETDAIGQFYGSGPDSVSGTLEHLTNQRNSAIAAAAQHTLAQAVSAANSNRLLSGDSSYATQQALNAMAGINAGTARETADQRLKNYLMVKQSQSDLAGRRNDLINALLRRQTIPTQFDQAVRGNDLSQLGALTSMEQNNHFYQLDNPENMLARRLGLLTDVGSADLRNNFYGLRAPYNPSGNGYVFPSSGGFRMNPDYFPSSDPQAPAFVKPNRRPLNTEGPPPPLTLRNAILQDYYENPEKYPGGMPQVQQQIMQQTNIQTPSYGDSLLGPGTPMGNRGGVDYPSTNDFNFDQTFAA